MNQPSEVIFRRIYHRISIATIGGLFVEQTTGLFVRALHTSSIFSTYSTVPTIRLVRYVSWTVHPAVENNCTQVVRVTPHNAEPAVCSTVKNNRVLHSTSSSTPPLHHHYKRKFYGASRYKCQAQTVTSRMCPCIPVPGTINTAHRTPHKNRRGGAAGWLMDTTAVRILRSICTPYICSYHTRHQAAQLQIHIYLPRDAVIYPPCAEFRFSLPRLDRWS